MPSGEWPNLVRAAKMGRMVHVRRTDVRLQRKLIEHNTASPACDHANLFALLGLRDLADLPQLASSVEAGVSA